MPLLLLIEGGIFKAWRLSRFNTACAIQICIVPMAGSESNSNNLFAYIVANSLFTPKQISIISKRLGGSGKAPGMSSGAYWRQVGQVREKVLSVLYSTILLESTGVLEPGSLAALGRMAEQLGSVMYAQQGSDIPRSNDVISVIDQLVKRMSKL